MNNTTDTHPPLAAPSGSAFAAITRLRDRFRSLHRAASECRDDAERRNDDFAAQQFSAEMSAYLHAAHECSMELDRQNAQGQP